MNSARATEVLLDEVLRANKTKVKVALEAGANVDGSHALSCTPIMGATLNNNVDMVSFLLDHGADPERPSDHYIPSPKPGKILVTPGERALHLAARRGNIDLVDLLQKRAHADPIAIDTLGRTPLMMACTAEQNQAAVVRLLLEAGADPALADDGGFTALHLAARHDRIDVVDMLCTRAPTTLMTTNTGNDCSPLAMACVHGHESMASPG